VLLAAMATGVAAVVPVPDEIGGAVSPSELSSPPPTIAATRKTMATITRHPIAFRALGLRRGDVGLTVGAFGAGSIAGSSALIGLLFPTR